LKVGYGRNRNEYGKPSKTLRQEDVKSKREKRIADYFTENGIRYEYETVAWGNKRAFRRIFARPDYYLPDYDVYVEYWGLAGASRDYEENMRRKMAEYNQNGIKFISLFPEDLRTLTQLDSIFRARFKTITGFELPRAVPRASIHFCSVCGTPAVPSAKFCARCGRKHI
jgi:hypothetical protein